MSAMKKTYGLLSPHLDERMRRLWCAAQAQALGHGGIMRVQEATGVSRSCITRGKKDLAASSLSTGAVRQPGGGRKRVTEHDPALLAALDALSEPTKRGAPRRGLRWTCKSTRKLARELRARGPTVSHTTVAQELHRQQYSRKGNRKTQEGASHPDRNAQFLPIHETASAVQSRGDPVISIATKKKELIGNYKMGAELGAQGRGPQGEESIDFLDKASSARPSPTVSTTSRRTPDSSRWASTDTWGIRCKPSAAGGQA
jgi:hypothetical protein